MKNIKTILLYSFLLCAFVACDKNDENKMTSLALQDIKAEALPGAVRLTWKTVEDPGFLYAKVSYYDFATQKTVTRMCSRYTDTLRIDGLLNKYGKYKFEFTAYDLNETPGKTIYIERRCEKALPYYIIAEENAIPLTVGQLTTNAQEPSEGPLSNVIDGNNDTYFQSFWDEWTYPELKPVGYHYIIFNLGKEVSAFKFQTWNRKKGGSLPKTVNIYVGTDGENWKLFRQLTNLPTEAGSTYTSELFISDTPVSYIKYEVAKGSDEYQTYFSLAEIKFFDIVRELIDPEAE